MAGGELEELFRAWRAEPVPALLPTGTGAIAGCAVVAAALRSITERKRQRRRVCKLGMALAFAAVVTGFGLGTWFELRAAPAVARTSGGACSSASSGETLP
jgi:hypothetical protein